MRGFLGFVVLMLAALAVAALVLVPIVVRPIVVDAVRAASPFGDQPIDVEVDLNPIGLLLGTIDRIRVTGSDLAAEGAQIGGLDLTVSGVETPSRTFRSLTGRLTAVALPFVQGETLVIDTIELTGASGDVSAQALLDVRSSLALVGNAFADAGVAVENLEITPGGVAFDVLGQHVAGTLAVDGGALVVPDVAGAGPLVIVEPGPDDPWWVTGVTVTAAGLAVDVSIDAGGVVGEG